MPTSLEQILKLLEPELSRGWIRRRDRGEDCLALHVQTQVYRNVFNQKFLTLRVFVENNGNFLRFLVDPFLLAGRQAPRELYQKLLAACMDTSLVQFELSPAGVITLTIEHPVLDSELTRAQFLYCCQTTLDVAEQYAEYLGT